MTFNFSTPPQSIDIVHVVLAVLALIFFILFLIKSGKKSAETTQNTDLETTETNTEIATPAPEASKPEPVKPTLKDTTPESALQLLALLQQDARFVDFINEDLTGFSDSDVGAAARVVHEGAKKTLAEYFTFTPVKSEEEETRITIENGFKPTEVRLTGNVIGEPPFTGTLVHKGWKVTDVKLPKLSSGHDTSIIAQAEVEL